MLAESVCRQTVSDRIGFGIRKTLPQATRIKNFGKIVEKLAP
jgi:hypothetical protein